MFRMFLLLIMSLILFSCNGNEAIDRMDEIKSVGDKDPKLAMKMLDSVHTDVVNASEYTRMKYELLKVRLDDKSNIPPTTNRMAEILADYFSRKGTVKEQQEAYFYAGSVYRDLDDTPRAIENFYKSIEAVRGNGQCDTILLRNTYSNLFCLFTNVQDNNTALHMAQKEYSLSCTINDMPINTIMHLASSLMDMNMKKKAEAYLCEALDSIWLEKNVGEDNYIYMLLYDFSNLRLRDKADKCYNLIMSRGLKRNDAFTAYIYGSYYEMPGLTDSAIVCYRRIFEEGKDEYAMYDASKNLFRIYSQKGSLAEANRYGAEFIRLSKRLDLAKNQKLAATVNNKYKYNLDRKYVQKTERERMLYVRATAVVSSLCLLLALGFVIFYIKKNNKVFRQQLAVADELSDVKGTCLVLQEELAEKTRQNQSLMQMLHRTEISTNAEDEIAIVKEAALGRRKLETDEWQRLYAAVDSLYPEFRDSLIAHLGKFTEQQMQVCYLMCIGLDNPQIKNVSDIPRTTIWRWTKACEWIYKKNEEKAMA